MGMGMDESIDHNVYDEYEEGLETRTWTTRGGGSISVHHMTLGHLTGARRVAQRAAQNATFSSERDKFDEWVDVFDDEIARRERQRAETTPIRARLKYTAPEPPRGEKVKMRCWCGCAYTARMADLKRGWTRSCSKSCAAIRRDFGRPSAQPLDGSALPIITKKKRR